jgi:NADPH:quinone reductase-like Zn-dependent oxidoreductase
LEHADMSETMRAAVFAEFGGPEVVQVQDVTIPEPGPGEVRVKVAAASMNHLDLWVRRGLPIETPMPHIGGADVAGTVEALGPGVTGVPEGGRVVVDPSLDYDWYEGQDQGAGFERRPLRLLGEHTQGGFAEYAVVPAANLLTIPEGFPSEEAAAAGLVFVTAWRGLVHRARLRPGERVLITGGSGGVATAAIQIAKMAGAKVYVVTSGPENEERVRDLGADVVYDRRRVKDFSREIWYDTGKQGVHVAFDAVGEVVWPQCLKALGVGGRLVTYGATTGARGSTEIRVVFWKQLSILGSTMGTPAEFREVMGLVFARRLRPVVHEVLPLAEARRAHEMLEGGGVFGKLVLVP